MQMLGQSGTKLSEAKYISISKYTIYLLQKPVYRTLNLVTGQEKQTGGAKGLCRTMEFGMPLSWTPKPRQTYF